MIKKKALLVAIPVSLLVILASAGLMLLLALSPFIIPPSEPDLSPEERRVADNAISEMRSHLDIWNVFIPKIAVHDVVYRSDNGKCDWVVYLRGYMYFYLPGGKMRVIMSCDGTHSLSGGLRSSWEDFEPLPPVE
jgi:hypothetical protein